MRTIVTALVTALVLMAGASAPGQAPTAQAAGVKVAIIVGATHSVTPRYREYANEVYAEAIKYTSNVVRVYSPSATASKVKSAVAGASVIVYLGHGNGWPSPYTYDPNYTTKDGFGLNYDLNGDGKTTDSENKYYGEPWIRELDPAPNAVVLLFHLCYASGNPESGAESSVSKARQRVDNYAAAFLRAGARAVVANGHSHDPYYIRALFTTRQTIDQYWRGAPDFNDHVSTYDSTRSPGYTYQMDPERTGYYYRSIAGKMSLRTQDVTGAAFADTSVDPAALVVPGNATPVAAGAPVYPSPEAAQAGLDPAANLGAETRVRVDARESVTSWVDGSPVYRVHTDAVEGWTTGASLVPRDSAAPRVWEVDDGAGVFSPNGDDTQDSIDVSVRLSESATWRLRFVDGDGDTLAEAEGESSTAAITWHPAAGSVPDGPARWVLRATDGWGNGPLEADGTVTVDTQEPELSVVDAEGGIPQFSPNGDGSGDTIGFAVDASEPGTVLATIRDAENATLDSASVAVGSAGGTITWDGKDADGAFVPDGVYRVVFVARDRAGNRSESQAREVAVFGALGFTASSRSMMFPQDGDTLVSSTTFSFRLRSEATVTWSIQDADGNEVRRLMSEETLGAGTYSASWNGRDADGGLVPRGTYRTVVTATDGTFSATQKASVFADAFKIVSSDTTPARGQRITVTATSTENLDAAPKLRIYQPGRSYWTVTMTKVGLRVYRATVTLKSGSTGTLKLRVGGYDSGGQAQATAISLPLH